ncbi:MAG: TonB family protein [Flavobacteriales bacterium]
MKKLLFILSILPFLSCGVKKELAESQKQNTELENRIKKLELENKALNKENERLAAIAKAKTDKAEYFHETYNTAETARIALFKKNQKLIKVIAELEKEIPQKRLETLGLYQELKNEDNYQKRRDAAVYKFVEEMPEFPGGKEKMFEFLAKNITYPEIAKENEVTGNVYIQFTVEKDGSLTDIKVVRGIGSGCDEEAVRAVKKMPNWIPGKQRKKLVRTSFILPIRFTLR